MKLNEQEDKQPIYGVRYALIIDSILNVSIWSKCWTTLQDLIRWESEDVNSLQETVNQLFGINEEYEANVNWCYLLRNIKKCNNRLF